LPGIEPWGEWFAIDLVMQPGVPDDHQFREQGARVGPGEIEQRRGVGRREAVKAGEVPLEFLFVFPAFAPIAGTQVDDRVEHDRVLRPVRKLRTHCPVTDRHVGADAIHHPVFLVLPGGCRRERVRVKNGDAQRWQLIVITHHVEAIVDVAVFRLPAQRKAPLAAVAGVLFGEPVVSPALAQCVGV